MQREDTLPREAIVADIGGTNARFAVADLATLELSRISQVLCAAYPTFTAAFCAYLADLSAPLDHAAIAVAAPVTGEHIHLTNSPWSFAKHELCRTVGLKDVLVLNDFEALALSLPHLAPPSFTRSAARHPKTMKPSSYLDPERDLALPASSGRGSGGSRCRAREGTPRSAPMTSASLRFSSGSARAAPPLRRARAVGPRSRRALPGDRRVSRRKPCEASAERCTNEGPQRRG